MLRVLTYHRIADPDQSPGLHPGLISASPQQFEKHMKYLKKRYAVLGMEEVLFCARKGRRTDPRAVLLTFDDAYRDFLENAWPILERYRLPVTLFVPTAYPDHPERAFWWDRLYQAFTTVLDTETENSIFNSWPHRTPHERITALRQIQDRVKILPHNDAMAWVDELTRHVPANPTRHSTVLTWDELRQLAAQGVTLGAHTRTHPILTQANLAQARAEICGSYRDLQLQIGCVLPVFSYPNGDHNESILRIVAEEGYEAAFTTLDGHNDLSAADPLRLRRTNITPRTTATLLRFRLSRWFAHIDQLRHSKRNGVLLNNSKLRHQL